MLDKKKKKEILLFIHMLFIYNFMKKFYLLNLLNL